MPTRSVVNGRFGALRGLHDIEPREPDRVMRLWIRCKYLEQQVREMESRYDGRYVEWEAERQRLLQSRDEIDWKHRELLASHQRHVAALERKVDRLARLMDDWKRDLDRVLDELEEIGARVR